MIFLKAVIFWFALDISCVILIRILDCFKSGASMDLTRLVAVVSALWAIYIHLP